MSAYSETVLIVPGSGVGGHSKRVLAVNALLVGGDMAAGYAPIVQEDGAILWMPVSGGAGAAVVNVTALPTPGLTTELYRLTDAATPANNGLYYRTETPGVYERVATGAELDAIEITLAAGSWSGNTYTIACTVTNIAALEIGLPCPTTAANRTAAADAGLWVSAVTATSVTLTADTAPTTNITIAAKGVTL